MGLRQDEVEEDQLGLQLISGDQGLSSLQNEPSCAPGGTSVMTNAENAVTRATAGKGEVS